MPFGDLRDYIDALERAGELLRITAPVSCHLEIAEITDRASKSKNGNNKALLFTSVKDYDMPVLINAFGSMKRICLALDVEHLDEIAGRIRQLIKPKVPERFIEKLAMLPTLLEVGSFPPKLTHGPAPCQEVVITDANEAMLDKLPIITCWPEDAGPFVTLGTVITRDPKSGIRNLGVYRLQKYGNNLTGMHWHKHHDGARHFEESRRGASFNSNDREPPNYGTVFPATPARQADNRLEVAVAIGCDPAVTYAATAPLPPDVDELVFAGFLRQSPVRLVKCKTVDLEVPASAEIVLEGYVNQSELKEEGPFGDHTGFYSLAGMFPVFRLTAITHRRNPIYQTTIVGKPPQEDCYLGKATERIFLPLVQTLVPEIVDMNLPWEGVFHNCAIISIDKRFPGHARKVMSAVWGLGQMMFSKFIIILDKDVNVHDLSEVALNVFGNTDPRRDMMFVDGPLDILDHACPILGYGSKVGIDATRKWHSEGFNRDWPQPIVMSKPIQDLVSERWAEYGFESSGALTKIKIRR
ncbi:MAG: menaquinone biosynthesis decarboxylase [Candidatus Melainabacteria bacterium]|nr:MAG: menaquinone biosynthesis decarboxylase [Candidatus Melainabacteria bacterium]